MKTVIQLLLASALLLAASVAEGVTTNAISSYPQTSSLNDLDLIPISQTNAGSGGFNLKNVLKKNFASAANLISNNNAAAITLPNLTATGTFGGSGTALSNLQAQTATSLNSATEWAAAQCPVPPLIYSSWFAYGLGATLQLMTNDIQRMSTNGMIAAGFNFVTVDDGWQGTRSGINPLPSGTNYNPSVSNVAVFAHLKGIKATIYTAYDSTSSCGGYATTPDSLVDTDVQQFLQWSFDGIKVDLCNLTPAWSEQIKMLRRFDEAIAREKNLQNPVITAPFMIEAATTPVAGITGFINPMPDAFPRYASCVVIGFVDDNLYDITNAVQWANSNQVASAYWGPGHYADSPAIIPSSTVAAVQANLSYIAMFNEKLNCGTSTNLLQYLTNQDWPTINRDMSTFGCSLLFSNAICEAYIKSLGYPRSGTNAILLHNMSGSATNLTIYSTNIGFGPMSSFSFKDIWAGTNSSLFTNSFTYNVPGNSVQLLRVGFVFDYSHANAITLPLKGAPWVLNNLAVATTTTTGSPFLFRDGTIFGTNATSGIGAMAWMIPHGQGWTNAIAISSWHPQTTSNMTMRTEFRPEYYDNAGWHQELDQNVQLTGMDLSHLTKAIQVVSWPDDTSSRSLYIEASDAGRTGAPTNIVYLDEVIIIPF